MAPPRSSRPPPGSSGQKRRRGRRGDWRLRRRLEFFPEDELRLADVIHFGHYNLERARPGLETHAHRRAMEFCYLVRGRQTYRVKGRDHRLVGGDVFLTFPDEPHGTGGAPEEKGELFWISLRVPEGPGPWLGLAPLEAGALRSALLGLRRRHFRGNGRIREHLDRMMDRLVDEDDALRTVHLQAHVVALLVEIVRASGEAARGGASARRPAPLEGVTRHIEARLAEPLPLAELARLAGLSLPRFKTRFKEVHGVPPGEFVLRARVEAARRRLEASAASITDIAYELGFSSSQYFATVMKRYTGRTPRELRAGARAGSAENVQ